MGIADLFSSPEVKAKKFLNENEALILKHIDEYHKSKEFNKGTPYEAKDLLAYVKGSLLKEYLYQVDAKDKNQKYFFAEPFFGQHVKQATIGIYDYFEKIDIGSRTERKVKAGLPTYTQRMQLDQAKAAQESINKILEFADRFDEQNQRTNKKKES